MIPRYAPPPSTGEPQGRGALSSECDHSGHRHHRTHHRRDRVVDPAVVMAKLSTEHLTDQIRELREVVDWLIQRSAPKPAVFCTTCGHGLEHHDPEEQSCDFPRSMGAPHALCTCLRFEMPTFDP